MSSADGKHFATRQDNGIVRYWDADKGNVLAKFDLKDRGGGHALMSADGQKLAAEKIIQLACQYPAMERMAANQ